MEETYCLIKGYWECEAETDDVIRFLLQNMRGTKAPVRSHSLREPMFPLYSMSRIRGSAGDVFRV